MERSPAFTLVALLATVALAAACDAGEAADPGPWDVLVTGGTVIDGTGAAAFAGDVAVRDGRIVRVSTERLPAEGTARVIDASGHVVAPGFIDIHAHLDPILDMPDAESHVRQGVTTALGNPDGGGPHAIAGYLDRIERLGVGLNVGFLVGHNSVRREVMGLDDRAPVPEELDEMKALVNRAMEEGAFGISTGLRYTPGVYSEIDEVVALSEVAARHGGFYTSHLRDEGMDLVEGVAEAVEIGRRAGIPVVLTHHKVVGAPMWGASERTLAMIDSARAEGIDVMADQYPYTATHTGISILVPPWALAGGNERFLERLDDPALHDSIFQGIVWNIVNDRGGNDLRRVQFSGVPWDPSLEGATLHDWAAREGHEPTPGTGARLVIEAMRRGGARTIFHALHEDDVERIMRHPYTAIASDGRLVRPGDGHPHPRWYGTFPRVLGHYVRERGVLELEDAVRKMTSLPADRAGFDGRGRIEEGAWADLVVFDPETVIDRSTFEDPHNYPEGIPFVVVNGIVTVDEGEFLDLRPGKVLRRIVP
jgi:N-acyl-D-amino-acid deacylase